VKARLLKKASGIGTPIFEKGTVVDIELSPGQRQARVKCNGILLLTWDKYEVILEDNELNDFLKEIRDDK
jgi:hypothetical protein